MDIWCFCKIVNVIEERAKEMSTDCILCQVIIFSQPAITRSKLKIETLEKMWNMFKVNSKDTKYFCCFYLVFQLLTLNMELLAGLVC